MQHADMGFEIGIEVRGVRKSFRTPHGTVEAVRGVDLSVAVGETVALLGPNGAGKSTVIDIVLGLTRPDEGAVSVFGMAPVAAIETGAVGATLQVGGLIRDLSVRELLTMVAALYPSPLPSEDVLALTGIGDIANRRTNKLSGGETQRVRFAMALVSNPRLLVLDEPTVAMDVEGRHSFWTTMREFAAGGRTVLFATHYLEEADAYADRAILLANGQVVADGPTTGIKALVGSRTIRATLPGAGPSALASLPGVFSADRHGDAVTLACRDSDTALRAMLARFPEARHIEITGAGLEEAFLELTRNGDELASRPALAEAIR
jgi:ABC-2 type transport system ATP-binding protein